MILKNITCRKKRGKPQVKKMADLPLETVEEAPPSTYCGMDYFGHFYRKKGRWKRNKWTSPKRNLEIGVRVKLKEEDLTCSWRLEETRVGKDGLICNASLKTGDGLLDRSIHKLVVQVEDGKSGVILGGSVSAGSSQWMSAVSSSAVELSAGSRRTDRVT